MEQDSSIRVEQAYNKAVRVINSSYISQHFDVCHTYLSQFKNLFPEHTDRLFLLEWKLSERIAFVTYT